MKVERRWEEGTLHMEHAGISAKNIRCAAVWLDAEGAEHRIESTAATYRCLSDNGKSAEFCLPGCVIRWNITHAENSARFTLSLRNMSERPIRIISLEPFVLNFTRGGSLEFTLPLAKAWVFAQRKGCGNIRPVYIWEETYFHTQFSADGMVCLYTPKEAMVAGFVTASRQFGKFFLSFDERNPERFRALCDTEETVLMPGREVHSEELVVILARSAKKAILHWAEETAKATNTLKNFRSPAGWSTWDYYFGDICEDAVLENVRYLKKYHDRFPVEYIQIDAGYCKPEGMWIEWDQEKFPHGPAWIAGKIREYGFKPGIWLIPFFVHPSSDIAKKHRDWLVKDFEGRCIQQPVLGSSFVLDGTHPGAQEYLRRLAHIITCEYGFQYIKMDGASAIGYTRGIRHDPAATGCEGFRKGLEAFRSGMAEKTFLLGAAGFGPSLGICNGMRVGEDVGARWDWSKVNVHAGERDRYHGSGNVKRCIESLLNSHYMHRRFWINDGDYLVVRTDRSELSLREAETWASVVALSGTSIILGDRMKTLPRERLGIVSKILPVYGKAGIPIDFLENPIPEVLVLNVSNKNERWKIVGLFNYSDQSAVKSVGKERLALKGDRYHAFSFWDQKYLGCIREKLSVQLEPHSCAVVSLRKDTGYPQIIGTDIHITQGGIEISESRWDSTGILYIFLRGSGRTGILTLYVPRGWRIRCVEPKKFSVRQTHEIAKLTVPVNNKPTICIKFSRKTRKKE